MISGRLVVTGEVGLHARPAAEFVREAERFKSQVRVSKDGMWANGKSILALLTLAAETGSELVLEVEGEDESEAFPVLKAKLEGAFD
ncbi:MAG TPA: HPr family phosphocarrier protein [candidate division WOR-3 bacterium]|uniref:Phosphocarrier protein HPr n=1 Tax=candidate division WOR-3 bacterium TaxID=2052148 RepID=A0A7V0T7T7_UNCW3|nr:HPr family phosphocarrier protein [candidate division WOR-3 bacterium]